jgi:hypothetical protein
MTSQWMCWIVLVAICFGAAAASGRFTDSSAKTWCPELLKPLAHLRPVCSYRSARSSTC